MCTLNVSYKNNPKMIRATRNEKKLVVKILTESFIDNQSVNYIVKQDQRKVQRIKNLMKYSFDVCNLFGEVFMSDNRKACALILLPDEKKTNMRSIMLDIKLVLSCTGLSNLFKALKREAKIKTLQPKVLMCYLWFIGVDPHEQHKGIGGALMAEVIKHAASKQRPVFLETSTLKNIPWYKRFGFTVYNELDLGYRLYFLKKE
jgi:ribosomal protein S18 acetylase RimI-like enzyme